MFCNGYLNEAGYAEPLPATRSGDSAMCTFIRLFVFTLIFAVSLPAAAFAAEKLPPGFIAQSESPMNWSDAKVFCQQQGGKLPRINKSDSWDGRGKFTVDGFGAKGAPWPPGLPANDFWTGTVYTGDSGYSWIVDDFDGNVRALNVHHRDPDRVRVVCIPAFSSAEERKRKAEEARKAAEEALKAAGFIALSETHMTWSDAKDFCQQQGGKLPRINGSDSWDGRGEFTVDGFGAKGAPWPSALPSSVPYWTGTAFNARPVLSWFVHAEGSGIDRYHQSNTLRVACVLPEAENRATEEAPKAEEARKAEEGRLSGVSAPELTVLQKTAELGNADAQFKLGSMYLLGQGVPRDMSKAAQWFQKAAEQGHADAQFNLGNAYAIGLGIERNPVKGAQWYQKAAEQGHAAAQLNLGNMYRLGRGVEKDEAKAVQWLQKAAEQGNAKAQELLKAMGR